MHLRKSTRSLLALTGRYLKQFFGEQTPIDQVTRQGARDWRIALARGDFSKGRVMAEVSVCHRCADARAYFKQAVDDDLLLFNPFDRVKVRSPKPDKDWHYVSIDQLDQLLSACRTNGWKMLIALCRLAGLRRGEALSLKWPGVDLHNRRLTIFAEKTGAKRIVPIDPRLHALLIEARAADQAQERVCDVSGHCLWRNFQVIRKRAALPRWKHAFQVMRRNCETDWAQRFPQYAVSEWIGHDIRVSATHYLAVPEELYAKAAATVETSRDAPKSAPNPIVAQGM
jgi:integrase